MNEINAINGFHLCKAGRRRSSADGAVG